MWWLLLFLLFILFFPVLFYFCPIFIFYIKDFIWPKRFVLIRLITRKMRVFMGRFRVIIMWFYLIYENWAQWVFWKKNTSSHPLFVVHLICNQNLVHIPATKIYFKLILKCIHYYLWSWDKRTYLHRCSTIYAALLILSMYKTWCQTYRV